MKPDIRRIKKEIKKRRRLEANHSDGRISAFFKEWQILFGIFVSLTTVSFGDFYSNYLDRYRDNDIRSTACFRLKAFLITDIHFIKESVEANKASLESRDIKSPLGHILTVPPLDDSIRLREKDFDFLDDVSIDAVLRIESFYHDYRSDLLNTSINYRAGDTVGINNDVNTKMYIDLSSTVSHSASYAIHTLEISDSCKRLSYTRVF